MRDYFLPKLELLIICSLIFPTLFPQYAPEWLLFLVLYIYFVATHKVYVTTKAKGHHDFGLHNTYRCLETGNRIPLNEDHWEATGTESCYGFMGFGQMKFVNSFNVKGGCKYLSLRVEVPYFFSSGIDFGLVEGYKEYYDDGQMGSGIPVKDSLLFFMAPTIRWSAAHQKNNFISIRQFGSATVTTEGRIEL